MSDYCNSKIQSMQREYEYCKQIGYNVKKGKDMCTALKLEKNQLQSQIPINQDKISEIKRTIDNIRYYLYWVKKHNAIVKENSKDRKQATKLTNRQKQILETLGEELTKLSMADYVAIYDYVLQNNMNNKDKILELLVDELLQKYKKSASEEIYIALRKIYHFTPKEYISIRKKIKSIKYAYEEQISYDPFYDVIMTLLDNEGIIYIRRLLERKEKFETDIVNVRNKDGEHIILEIQRRLFESCFVELENRTKVFIHKEFYQEVLQLFLHQDDLRLTTVEKEQLSIEREAFIASLKGQDYKLTHISRERQDFFNNIKRHHYKKSSEIIAFINHIKENQKQKEKTDSIYYPTEFLDKNRYPQNGYIFAFSDHHPYTDIAYSIAMTETGNCIVKVYNIDAPAFIDNDSAFNQYLREKMLNGSEPLPQEFTSAIQFEQYRKKPAITYEIEVNQKGKIIRYQVYESLIAIDQFYNFDQLHSKNIKMDTYLYPLNYLLGYLNIKRVNSYGREVEKVMKQLVKKVVSDHVNKNNFPMIYHVQEKRSRDTYCSYMNKIVHVLGKINSHDAYMMHSILIEDTNYAHYGLENIGHSSLNDIYCIEAFHPLNNYIDLTIQRIIKDLFIYKRSLDEQWLEEIKKLIPLVNQMIEERRADKRKFLK